MYFEDDIWILQWEGRLHAFFFKDKVTVGILENILLLERSSV